MNIEHALKEHQLWLTGKGGKQADLSGAKGYLDIMREAESSKD